MPECMPPEELSWPSLCPAMIAEAHSLRSNGSDSRSARGQLFWRKLGAPSALLLAQRLGLRSSAAPVVVEALGVGAKTKRPGVKGPATLLR